MVLYQAAIIYILNSPVPTLSRTGGLLNQVSDIIMQCCPQQRIHLFRSGVQGFGRSVCVCVCVCESIYIYFYFYLFLYLHLYLFVFLFYIYIYIHNICIYMFLHVCAQTSSKVLRTRTYAKPLIPESFFIEGLLWLI